MKKKKTYILLIVVITVWGFLLFKIYFAFFGEDDSIVFEENRKEIQPQKRTKTKKLQVEYPERDPFLGMMYKPEPKTRSKPLIQKRQSYDSIFNAITYQGFIKNKKDSSRLYLINYKKRSFVLKPNHQFEDVIFLTGTKDEIKVKYKSITKTIEIED
jgi:hypothetical protein